ncbi:MAG: zf-HC2 domain-containing protein [Polyangiaceae bacterium]
MKAGSNAAGREASWSCRDFAQLLGPYLDGELDAPTLVETEGHLGSCDNCRERLTLLHATRASLKRTSAEAAPEGLRSRLQAAMAAEVAREDARETAERRASLGVFSSWRTVVPLASAAAAGIVFFSAVRSHPPKSDVTKAGFGDDVLSELIAEHARPLPPERTDPKDVRAFEQYVGVPVRPAKFERGGARLLGGRMLPLRQERAAMLQYEIGQGADTRRMSVIIYDPRRIQVHDDDLTPKAVGSAEVLVGHAQGYSVAVANRGGVGYAMATDLDPEKSAQFVSLVEDE